MKTIIKSFLQFFTRPIFYIKKHIFYSFFVLIINFAFYFFLAILVTELFQGLFVENILLRISAKSIFLSPLYLLNDITGNPVLGLFRPLILYLTYSLAFALSTILTGTILSILSRTVQEDTGYSQTYKRWPNGFLKFFAGIKEEIIMLSFSISWSAVIFFIALIPDIGMKLSIIVFYLFTPFLYGMYNLSYPFLRWGANYSFIAKTGFRNIFSFLGFSYASASGFFLILFFLGFLSGSHFAFAFLFALNALFRPIGVISGTLTGIDYDKKIKTRDIKKGLIAGTMEFISIILALIVIVTVLQFYFQSKSKTGFIDCRYSVESLKLNLPDKIIKKNILGTILSLTQYSSKPQVKLKIKVENKGTAGINLEDFNIDFFLKNKSFGNAKIDGFKLKPGAVKILQFKLRIDLIELGKNLISKLLSGKFPDFKIKGWVYLNLWFGKLKYPVFRI